MFEKLLYVLLLFFALFFGIGIPWMIYDDFKADDAHAKMCAERNLMASSINTKYSTLRFCYNKDGQIFYFGK